MGKKVVWAVGDVFYLMCVLSFSFLILKKKRKKRGGGRKEKKRKKRKKREGKERGGIEAENASIFLHDIN